MVRELVAVTGMPEPSQDSGPDPRQGTMAQQLQQEAGKTHHNVTTVDKEPEPSLPSRHPRRLQKGPKALGRRESLKHFAQTEFRSSREG